MNFTEEPEDVCFVITIAAGQSVSLKQFVSRHINEIGLLVGLPFFIWSSP